MHDTRHAVRQLTHRPAFAITIILTLALGSGANAIVFGAVRAVLLRPLPFGSPGELVALWETQPGVPVRSVAPANFLDWRSAKSFDGLAAYAGVNVVDLHSQVTGASAPMLWMLSGVVACVLAVACGNVATRLLAAAIGRGRELKVRAALGASRARLVRQLTSESLMLALCGATVGLALAWVANSALIALLPASVPRTASIALDGGVVLFALGLCALTALFFGAAPAMIATRGADFTMLRDGGRSGGSKSSARVAAALVVGQLAVVLVLLTGTGLMLRTLWTLHQRDVGIDVDRLLALDVTLPDARSRGRAAAVLDLQPPVGERQRLNGGRRAD